MQVEVNGGDEVVRQTKDKPADQFGEAPIIDIPTQDAERELGIAPNRNHDEADATKNGAHGGQVGNVKRISIRRALAQGA